MGYLRDGRGRRPDREYDVQQRADRADRGYAQRPVMDAPNPHATLHKLIEAARDVAQLPYATRERIAIAMRDVIRNNTQPLPERHHDNLFRQVVIGISEVIK